MELDVGRSGLSSYLLQVKQKRTDAGNMREWLEMLSYMARHTLQTEQATWMQIRATRLEATAIFVLSGFDWKILPVGLGCSSVCAFIHTIQPFWRFYPLIFSPFLTHDKRIDKRIVDFLNSLQESVNLCLSKGAHIYDAPRIVAGVKQGSLVLKLDLTDIFKTLAKKATPSMAFATMLALILLAMGVDYMNHAENMLAEQNRHEERMAEIETDYKIHKERLYHERELRRITLDHLEASGITLEELAAPWKKFVSSLDRQDYIRFDGGRNLQKEELLRAIDDYGQNVPSAPTQGENRASACRHF